VTIADCTLHKRDCRFEVVISKCKLHVFYVQVHTVGGDRPFRYIVSHRTDVWTKQNEVEKRSRGKKRQPVRRTPQVSLQNKVEPHLNPVLTSMDAAERGVPGRWDHRCLESLACATEESTMEGGKRGTSRHSQGYRRSVQPAWKYCDHLLDF
jgi:hypothetical protein